MAAAALRGLMVLLLVVLTLLPAGCRGPGRVQAPESPAATSRPSGRLQEVAPPGAVRQLQERLAQRQPALSILAPATDSLLPAGPWELVIRVRDWPLVQLGERDWGPHLVVQLDDREPIRIAAPEDGPLHIPMPALSPGSHRLTAYAASPWGEAMKTPGSMAQIRLHRVAANPIGLPEPGSPQLIPVHATRSTEGEPALIDWLLLDSPLQHLREGDERWRLRLTVNGDSFLLDQNVPLWLRGLRSGSNAVLLELVDRGGQPLNPPFNSIVQEVVLEPGPPSDWQRGNLAPEDLERWLGLARPPVAAAVTAADAPEQPLEAPQEPPGVPSEPPADSAVDSRMDSAMDSVAEAEPDQPGESPPPLRASEPVDAPPAIALQEEEATPPEESSERQPQALDAIAPSTAIGPETTDAPSPDASGSAGGATPSPEVEASEKEHEEPAAHQEEPGAIGAPLPADGPGDAAPVRARDLVNADGSLIKPAGRGLLDRLRARFAG